MDITLKDGTKVPVLTRRSVKDIITRPRLDQSPSSVMLGGRARYLIRGYQVQCPICGCGPLDAHMYMCQPCYESRAGTGDYAVTTYDDHAFVLGTRGTDRPSTS